MKAGHYSKMVIKLHFLLVFHIKSLPGKRRFNVTQEMTAT